MYKVKSHKSKRGKINHNIDFVNLDGFIMSYKKKYFMIDGEKVSFVKVVDEDLVKNIVTNQVRRKYKNLIKVLTDYLISESDDEQGTMREVLDRIEKFRQEIKNKYRSYLEKDELEKMSSQLKVLQKEAKERLNNMTILQMQNVIGRNR